MSGMCSLLPYGSGICHCAYNVSFFLFLFLSVHFFLLTGRKTPNYLLISFFSFLFCDTGRRVSVGGGWGVDPA